MAAVAFLYASNFGIYTVSRPIFGTDFAGTGVLESSSPGALFRWLRLVRAPADKEKGSTGSLSAHVPGDEACPCWSCCNWVQNTAGFLSILDAALSVLSVSCALLLPTYTPLVSYSSTFWTTYRSFVGSFTLEQRLHCRAVSIAIEDLLGRFRAAAANGEPPPVLKSWLYVRLHYRFAAMCRFRRRQDSLLISRLLGLVQVPGMVVFVVLSVAVGRCLIAWQLVYLAYSAFYFTFNGITLASRNALIDAVAGVYRDAQRDLRALQLRTGAGEMASEIALHIGAISSFLEISHHRARLFGFVVSYGTVRTMLVTGLTVCVALWTVFRSLGVFVTLESFCPTGL
ncbi:hypothetical protein DFJ74DRAFT_684854 [Hyaloraphidium curvatum]|nr:hypothetical protein DFJ74DRAFT_684854 [Hyaloraphidium curvatum]